MPVRLGRTLRRGLGADPATLDPQLADDNAALAVVVDLYEGLATERPDGTIVPGAASSWTVDERGLAWTFHLRPDLRWSNGDPLTAEHFTAGLKRALDPATGSPYAGLLAAIKSVDVIDAQTLHVRLSRPLPYLPALLALPAAAPFHPAAATLHPPPSNGPYRLAGRAPGQHIELERNPHWREAAGVAIARVEHVVVSDLTTELNLYRTGELDLTSEVPNSQLDALRRTSSGELRLAPYLGVYAYAVKWQVYLDTRRHPVDCDLVRFGWSADIVDPDAFAVLFESGNPQNTLGYASAAYDERLATSRTRDDDALRMALLAEAEAVLLDDVPVIPLFFRVSKRLVAPDLLGVTATPLGHVASRELRFAAE